VADGVLALILGEGGQERVHEEAAALSLRRDEMQGAILDDEAPTRWDDVHVVALDTLRLLRDPDGEMGHAGEDLGKEALVLGVEVLDEHVGESAVRWEAPEKVLECLQAACRGTDAHDEDPLPFPDTPFGLLLVAGSRKLRFFVRHGRLSSTCMWQPFGATWARMDDRQGALRSTPNESPSRERAGGRAKAYLRLPTCLVLRIRPPPGS